MTILASVLIGLALGYLALRQRLCAVTATAEYAAGDYSYLKALGLSTLVCLAVLPGLSIAGLVTIAKTQTVTPIPALLGGAFFGYAAPFARGSILGLLYRSGAGRLHALAAFVLAAIVAAIVAQWLVLGLVPGLHAGWDLPAAGAVFHDPTTWWIPSLLASVAAAILLWTQRHAPEEDDERDEPRAWRMTGAALATIVLVTWLLSGEHGPGSGPEDLPAMRTFSSVLIGGPSIGSEWMAGLVLGVVLGGTLASFLTDRFEVRWPRFADPFETVVGALGLGVGTALAGGGSLTHLLTSPSTGSVNAALFLLAMFFSLGLGYRHRERRHSPDARRLRRQKRVARRKRRAKKRR